MNKQYFAALMTLAMMMDNSGYSLPPEKGETIEEFYERLRKHKQDLLIKRGLKEFTIDGYTVIALNEKNAKRKINKLKLNT